MKTWGLAAVLLALTVAGWIALDERKARQARQRVREYHNWQNNGGQVTPPPIVTPPIVRRRFTTWWE